MAVSSSKTEVAISICGNGHGVEFFCAECNHFFCAACGFRSHRTGTGKLMGHEVEEITKVIEEQHEEEDRVLGELQKTLTASEQLIEKEEKSVEETEEVLEFFETETKLQFGRMKGHIQQLRQLNRNAMSLIRERSQASLVEPIPSVIVFQKSMNDRLNAINLS